MRRLSVAALSLSSCAAIVAMLAVPASAHDDGRHGGHDGRGHDDAATAPVAVVAAPAVVAAAAGDDAAGDVADEGAGAPVDPVASAAAASDDGLELDATLTGSSVGGPVIAGAAAGGRPWTITEGEVEYEDGILTADITGLVIPPGGTNPLAKLSVSIVCGGAIAATSAAVPFSTTGNAMVNQALTVPSMCANPQVLVHPLTNTKVYIAFG